MIPDWPPPVCTACKDGRHDECDPIPFCECHHGVCVPLLGEETP